MIGQTVTTTGPNMQAFDGYGLWTSTQAVSGTTTLSPRVAENVSAAADLPQSQSATCAGKMTLFDFLGSQVSPTTLAQQFSPGGTPSASYVGYYGATRE